MNQYSRRKTVEAFPRIPLEGYLDLTYRCNNDCLHCWLRIEPDSQEIKDELSLDEIGRIAAEAKGMGCRKWIISGGEPMLRPDFPEIFQLITAKSASFLLNTNGTLITPLIARLLKKRGVSLVALYGADARVHDAVTRRPGSFEAVLRGIAYLKEAGAEFMPQIVPMRANFHQFEDMKRLALSLSPRWRVGATWLYLSAEGDPVKNREIEAQRLTPREAFEIERPDFLIDEEPAADGLCAYETRADDFFSDCIRAKHDFHIDPYGRMTFCGIVKDSALRFDLRRGSFREAWEEFIPALAGKIRGGEEFRVNCGLCGLRTDCGWCPSYAYLEPRRFPAKIEYLCRLTEEKRRIKKDWIKTHRRYYDIADITIQVDSDIPIEDKTFLPYVRSFEVETPGKDIIRFRHHFHFPAFENVDLGTKVYQAGAWTIFKKGGSWIYFEGAERGNLARAGKIAVINNDHTHAKIYHMSDRVFRWGSLSSLSLLPTDQILLARILADRQGCLLHACGVSHEGKGLLFVGHSEAGKSSVGKMYAGQGVLLCDDRIALRRWPDGYSIYGTWHPGELREVSHLSAPLAGLFFLEKSDEIRIARLRDKAEVVRRLAACLIKPLATADWWEKVLTLLERIAEEVPCYDLRFDRSGRLVDRLKEEL
ncbi:MAG: radical SAM protein [Candidatus Aminicenantes bacterium]|nr:radical SAM protein [Candidatus Aminicenantes bacterium]